MGGPRCSDLCPTSHFGCRCLQVASCEGDQQVALHAVRSMGRPGATRTGWIDVAKLRGRSGEDGLALSALSKRLELTGVAAPVAECVVLALDRRTVHRQLQHDASAPIGRRACRLSVPLAPMTSIPTHPTGPLPP